MIVTLDSHHKYDIAHPGSWKEVATGKQPAPFTLISSKDLADGKYTTSDAELLPWAKEYTLALEAGGRFQLCIWPEHCLIGSPGHNVQPDVQAGLTSWLSRKGSGRVYWHLKGQNRKTEMYSALKAEVPVPDDPGTHLNTSLLSKILSTPGKIYVAGQARSHCVAFTVRDLVANLGGRAAGDVVLVRDCMSDVPGFEESGEKFFDDMEKLGVGFCDSGDVK